ncbi:class E sortase [Streptomyces sp. NPDC004111]|uniref:class E sortase n=1 Tax=Streptomyces sp. NPDC004111 TaxID=3364690 RepID=UPI003695D564
MGAWDRTKAEEAFGPSRAAAPWGPAKAEESSGPSRSAEPRRSPLAHGLWIGAEFAVTCGVVLMLLVAHQLWWTNQEAKGGARDTVRALVEEWGAMPADAPDVPPPPADGAGESGAGEPPAAVPGSAGAPDVVRQREQWEGGRGSGGTRRVGPPRWDQAYAVLRIPKVGVVAPVAAGVSKRGVLDKGYVGHYPGTAQPGTAGNFAVAGHRNTHGEPFRYINRLRTGDEVVVETREAVYTYVVSGGIAQTSARDVDVIGAVPRSGVKQGYGYREPGYYLTLTTCTPEFTSRYRLVVWGKLARVRPR